MPRASAQVNRVKELEAKVALLEAELAKQRSTKRSFRVNWRRVGKWLSVGLAGGILAAGSVIFYVGLSLTNTDRFMNIASPLIRQSSVQQAIAAEATDKLYEQVDTQQILSENLPPKLQFLAPQLSDQIQKLTEQKAQQVLASPGFQNVWDNTLSTVHSKLIAQLQNYEGDGTITINDVYQQLSKQLVDSNLSFLAGKQLPAKVGSITVVQSDYLPLAHNVVSNMTTARILTILIFLLLVACVVLLSKTKRQGIIHVGLLIGLVSFALLVSLRIGGIIVGNNAEVQFSAAARDTWQVVTNPYRLQLIGQVVFGFGLALVAWIGGPAKNASKVRESFNRLLEGRFHQAIFKNGETGLSKWIAKRKNLLTSTVAVGFVLSLVFIPISILSISLAALIAILLIAIITLLAAPR